MEKHCGLLERVGNLTGGDTSAHLGLMWWYRAWQFWQAYGEAKAD
jgi:hypothetical protein